MVQNKKQHFVPKFYFRLFSDDNSKINIYNLDRQKYFREPFKHQCFKKYFYSKNSEIEKSFDKLEGRYAIIIRKIIKHKSLFRLTPEEYTFLLSFIVYQHSRTEQEKDKSKETTRIYVEEFIKPLMKEGGISKELINSINIKFPADHLLKLYVSFTRFLLISDLIPVLIINDTKEDFIFSDSPVIFHNSYFNHLKTHGTRGLQSRGLQIFCPLNRKLILTFYDNEIYLLNRENTSIHINLVDDVDSINSLQFLYAKDNIYFSNENQFKKIKNLHKELYSKIKKRTIKTRIIKRIKNPDGSYTEIIQIYQPNIDYNLSLSFIKFTRDKSIEYGVRNPELIQFFDNQLAEDFFK